MMLPVVALSKKEAMMKLKYQQIQPKKALV